MITLFSTLVPPFNGVCSSVVHASGQTITATEYHPPVDFEGPRLGHLLGGVQAPLVGVGGAAGFHHFGQRAGPHHTDGVQLLHAGVQAEPTPPKAPWKKGKVERKFGHAKQIMKKTGIWLTQTGTHFCC